MNKRWRRNILNVLFVLALGIQIRETFNLAVQRWHEDNMDGVTLWGGMAIGFAAFTVLGCVMAVHDWNGDCGSKK